MTMTMTMAMTMTMTMTSLIHQEDTINEIHHKPTSAAPPSSTCSPPENPQLGFWHCLSSLGGLLCSLECPPGFAPTLHSVTACSLSSPWTRDPSLFSCSKAVALLTSGKSVQLFRPGNFSKVLPSLPDTRDGGHTLEYVDSHAVLCGGGGHDYYEYGRSCLSLTKNLAWTPISFPRSKREQHASVVLLGQLFLLGGGWESKTIEMAVPRGEMFDWNVGPNLTEVCHRSCAVKVSPTEVVILGSGSGSGRAVTLYQWGTWEASRMPELPEPLSDPGCVLVDNPVTNQMEIVVTGSSTNTYILDLQTLVWRYAAPTPVAGVRRLAFLGNQLFSLGSQEPTVLEFNFSSETWTETTHYSLLSDEHFDRAGQGIVLTHISEERISKK